MAKKFNNAITTTAGFNYAAQQPLDDRAVVDIYDDLAELIGSGVSYEGMEVYVVADKKSYKLIGTDWKAVATEENIPSIAGLATETYVDTAANRVKNDLLNGAGDAYDTLKELGDLINENVDAIDALESVAIGKADKEHSHPELISSGTADPTDTVTSQFYFKYIAD